MSDRPSPRPAAPRDGPTLPAGTVFAGTYEVVRLIAVGGMGQVYEARNRWTQRHVALKVLPTGIAGDDASRRRFAREARLSARLVHRHVVRILDMGTDAAGSLFMVHELVQGETLEACQRRQGRLELRTALRIFVPIMDALALAHDHGIVHRDVKPANILLAQKADDYIVPLLTDFGLAISVKDGSDSRITLAGTLVGTPKYMSPELVQARPDVDARTDVWSVAVSLYEVVTGQLPFRGRSALELMLDILRQPVEPPSSLLPRLPAEFDAAILRALSRKPADRFATMREFRQVLKAIDTSRSEPPVANLRAQDEARRLDRALAAAPALQGDSIRDTIGSSAAVLPALHAMAKKRPLRIGVVQVRSVPPGAAIDDAFTMALGFRCDVLRYFTHAELVDAIVDGDVEFACLPPVAFARARQTGAARLLMVIERDGSAMYSSALLARASAVSRLADIRGRRAAWVDPWSAAGYMVPRWMLRAAGFSPDADLGSQGFLGSYEAVREALRAGTADVGASYCTVAAAGSFLHKPWSDEDGLRVLAVSEPFPGDTICARGDLSQELEKFVVSALGNPSKAAPVLQAFGATRLLPGDPSAYRMLEKAMAADAPGSIQPDSHSGER